MTINFVLGFASIKDQARPIRILTTLFRRGKIPHAMLFTGTDGIGKRSVAMAFAAASNCLAGGEHSASAQHEDSEGELVCGQCRSCKKIQAGSHPDILRIEPAGQFIRIAQIREMLHVLSMKPYEAKLRVVLISEAHTMNLEAANALLKVLEEPPDRTILILTARGTAELLPTIVSRCRQIRFNPLSSNSLADMLSERQGIFPEKARVLAAMADGSYRRALDLHRQNWLDKRHWLIHAGGFLSLPRAVRPPVAALMALALRLVENKNRLMEALELLTMLYRDIAVSKFRRETLMNEDLSDRIIAAAEQMSETDIFLKIQAIEDAGKRVRGNANPRLTVERLLMRLAGYLPMEYDGAEVA